MAVAQVGPVTAPGLVGARFIGQWNWGASFLTPWWLMTHRRARLGIIYIIVSAIPYLNVLTLGCLIYFGRNGNRIAVLSGRFTDEAQFVAVQNAWRNWAFGLALIPILFILGVGVYNAYSHYMLCCVHRPKF